jgi:cytochrome c oxidase subunit 2
VPTIPAASDNDSGRVAARAELRWTILVIAIVVFLLGMVVYMSLHWAMMPPARIETIDPTTLHLAGEFTEGNLGTAIEADGSVTVRVVGQQYSFTPQCLLLPANTQVRVRGTSADAVHGFIINGTNINVMLEPGYISTFEATFKTPADHVMPCHEFCGVGHAAMWAHVRVIDKEDFFKRAAKERRLACAL